MNVYALFNMEVPAPLPWERARWAATPLREWGDMDHAVPCRGARCRLCHREQWIDAFTPAELRSYWVRKPDGRGYQRSPQQRCRRCIRLRRRELRGHKARAPYRDEARA